MARLQFRMRGAAALVSLSLLLPACGGKKAPPPVSGIPAKINLIPSVSYSIQGGSTVQLIATAQNSANSTVNAVFTYNSSNPAVLSISPSGLVCAGQWNAPAYTVCTPGTAQVVEVTATADGVTSAPTLFFVHAPIGSIQVSVVPPVNQPPAACPTQGPLPAACNIPFNTTNCSVNAQGVYTCGCLSQNQIVTLQATALDVNGNDMTAEVGPFTWVSANPTVPKITPIVTVTAYNVPTNQATVSPSTPGQTQIVASASGAFSQPYSFETCPIQCIDLAVGQPQSGVTNFVTNKGTSETLTATAVDFQGCIVPKPGLTWVSSEPASIAAGGACSNATTCTVTTPQQGAASITATCTPPNCNIGFPLTLAGVAIPPQPVYPVTAISGLVTGTATTTTILSTSQDCYSQQLCDVGLYNVSSSTNLPSGGIQVPTPPNSLMYDLPGDKAYVGSEFGAFTVNPSNIGTSTSPFSALTAPGTPLGLVTGRILSVSPNGNNAVFSDTIASPNQVYFVSASPVSTVPLNLNGGIAAAFSPDGLRAYILADAGTSLYSYSTLQYLQPVTVPLASPATQIVFNGSGTFALLAGGVAAPDLSIYNTCDNSTVTLVSANVTSPLTSPPQLLTMVPGQNIPLGSLFGNTTIPSNLDTAGLDFFIGLDNLGNGASSGIDVIATNTLFFPPSSSPPVYPSLCALPVTLAQLTPATTPPAAPNSWTGNPFHISLGQGTFQPILFFMAASATQAYIVTSDVGVLIYNFNTNAVSKIPLINNASPVAASVTADGAFIYVAGSDGLLHQLNPSILLDENQTSFLPLPNSSNDFCFNETTCSLDLIAVKP
jgi:hypothetical protein